MRSAMVLAVMMSASILACSGGGAEIGPPDPNIDGGVPVNDAGAVTPDSASIADRATQCPSALPASSSTCSVPTLECVYGSDARPWCRDRAQCTLTSTATNETVWNVAKQSSIYSTGTSCTGAAPACPGAPPNNDEKCTEASLCTYGANGVSCVCYDRNAGCGACESTNFRWTCAPLPAPPCPSTPPNVGSACAVEGASCQYGKCETLAATSVTCTTGAWKRNTAPCK